VPIKNFFIVFSPVSSAPLFEAVFPQRERLLGEDNIRIRAKMPSPKCNTEMRRCCG
jgi:hypothetical protein